MTEILKRLVDLCTVLVLTKTIVDVFIEMLSHGLLCLCLLTSLLRQTDRDGAHVTQLSIARLYLHILRSRTVHHAILNVLR